MEHIATREIWQSRIDEFRKSGLSVRAWCEETGLSPEKVRYWQKRVPYGGGSSPETEWLPVQIATGSGMGAASPLKLRISNVFIDVAAGFDPALLRAVVEALGGLLC